MTPLLPSGLRGWRLIVILAWIAAMTLLVYHSYPPLLSDTSNLPPVSKMIWQVTSDDGATIKRQHPYTPWRKMNDGYEYTMHGDSSAVVFAREHYGHHVAQILQDLGNKGVRADLIRYLLLGAKGGVYADTDVRPLKPIDEWIPEEYRDRAKLVVGIEWDERDGDPADRAPDLMHELQFCQWTIASSPRHPVFTAMLERALSKIDQLRREQGARSVSEVVFKNSDILNSTGPAAWTDIVFDHIRSVDSRITKLKDFSMLKEPTLAGDVLVLPIDGFATGVPHSGAVTGRIPDNALIRHLFMGTWRDG